MILQVVFMIIGFILLVKGADLLVDGGSNIAKKFHIPELVIGLTIVSVGTSMPELMVSLTSALDGHSDLSVGNAIGSNISNLLLILGICAIIKNLKFKSETKYFESPFALIVTVLLFVLANNYITRQANTINRIEGIILLAVCTAFVTYNIIIAKKGDEFEGINKNLIIVDIKLKSKRYMVKSIFFIILGIVFLKFGGDLVVNSATNLAKLLGMSEKIISLTIVSIATSLPELFTSVVATRKGQIDIAIGNVIGSCIFNVVLIIGVTACITPIPYSVDYNVDFAILILATLLLCVFPFVGRKGEMTRANGMIYFGIYVMYMLSLCQEAWAL